MELKENEYAIEEAENWVAVFSNIVLIKTVSILAMIFSCKEIFNIWNKTKEDDIGRTYDCKWLTHKISFLNVIYGAYSLITFGHTKKQR